MSIIMKMPHELMKDLAKRAKHKRLALNLSQSTLSERSGVSYGSLKKFESTGRISLESLLKLALILDSLTDFEHVFSDSTEQLTLSLDELLKSDTKEKTRKRGRK